MATVEQIKKAILDVAGNPDSGIIKELSQSFAEAVYALDNEAPTKADKEVRVVQAKETR
jgi:hypothetical protein